MSSSDNISFCKYCLKLIPFPPYLLCPAFLPVHHGKDSNNLQTFFFSPFYSLKRRTAGCYNIFHYGNICAFGKVLLSLYPRAKAVLLGLLPDDKCRDGERRTLPKAQ